MRSRWRLAGGLIVGVALVAGGAVLIVVAGDGGSESGRDALAACEVTARPGDLNRQVRLTTSGERVEFELWSSEPFPTRALFPVVRIGSRDFSRSTYPPDGRLDTLIFFIPREEFEALSPDDPVWVFYGGAGDPPPDFVPDPLDPWNFGSFRKDLLDCPT